MEERAKYPFELLKGGNPNSNRPYETLADLKRERIVDISDIDFFAPQRGETIHPKEIVDFGKLVTFPTLPPKNSA